MAKTATSAANSQSAMQAAIQQAAAKVLQRQAMMNVGNVALTGLGVGAGVRGLTGLLQLINRNVAEPRPSVVAPAVVPISTPADEEEEKAASLVDFLQGNQTETLAGIPWYMPAAVGAGVGATAGGWKFMDWLLDRRRKHESDAELEQAKSEFETTLSEIGTNKQAADNTLGGKLDQLYSIYEKNAASVPEWLGRAAGGYGTYAGLSGLLAAVGMYGWTRKRSRRRLIDSLQRKRLRERYEKQPAAILAAPSQLFKAPPAQVDPFQTSPADSSEDTLEL